MNALFVTDGTSLVPTDLARGPWTPDALHGGPVSALLARAVESCPTNGVDFEVARLTVELLRPVPTEPLTVTAEVARDGRKVQLLEATLRHAATGTELARARALRIRRAPLALPQDDPLLAPDHPPEPGPDEARPEVSRLNDDYLAFHNAGTEHRFAAGTWLEAGPVTVWIRLLAAVVDGETPTPLQRAAAAADYGNGVSRLLSWETHTFINPELTVHLLRQPVGEWVCLDARSTIADHGIGLAESVLFDVEGRIGRAAQSLLVEERRG